MLSIYRGDIKEKMATVALQIDRCRSSAKKAYVALILATPGSPRPSTRRSSSLANALLVGCDQRRRLVPSPMRRCRSSPR